MKITVDKRELVRALEACAKTAASNKAIVVLQNVVLEAEGAALAVHAMNLESAVRVAVAIPPCKEPGKALVDCAALLKYAKLIPSDLVEMSTGGGKLAIRHAKGLVKLALADEATYPEFQLRDETSPQTFVFPNGEFLAEAAQNGAAFVGEDNFHPHLKCLRLYAGDGLIGYSASDSVKLIDRSAPCPGAPECEVLVVPEMLPLIESAAREHGGECRVDVREKSVTFQMGDMTFVQQRVGARYPNVKRVFPTSSECVVKCKRDELLSALRRMAPFLKDSDVVVLKAEDGAMSLTYAGDMHDFAEGLSCSTGCNAELGVSARKMMDCLKAFPTEDIEMSYAGPSRPLVFRHADVPGLGALLMPMHYNA